MEDVEIRVEEQGFPYLLAVLDAEGNCLLKVEWDSGLIIKEMGDENRINNP